MKTLVLAFGFVIIVAPAFAQAIAPADAKAQVGKTVTVEGTVDNVHTTAAGNACIVWVATTRTTHSRR